MRTIRMPTPLVKAGAALRYFAHSARRLAALSAGKGAEGRGGAAGRARAAARASPPARVRTVLSPGAGVCYSGTRCEPQQVRPGGPAAPRAGPDVGGRP